MDWDYPRDDFGRPLREKGRVLKMDPRPDILKPERKVYREKKIDGA